MISRRQLLAVLGTTAFAGCSSTSPSIENESNTTTDSETTGSTDPKLAAGTLHDNWIQEDATELSQDLLDPVTQAYVEGREDRDLHTGLYQAVETANNELGYLSSTPLGQHKNLVALVDEVLGDSHQLYSTLEKGKTAIYNESNWPVSRIWLEQDTDQDDTTDILAALNYDTRATHLKNTNPDNPSTALQELLAYRKPEEFVTRGPHDIEAMRNVGEYNENQRGIEYTDADIEEANGSWLEEFGILFWGDGMAVPVQDNWEEYHTNFHSVHPEVNQQYFNSKLTHGETTEIGAFSIENGEVTLYETISDYDPGRDGMPTEQEIKQI